MLRAELRERAAVVARSDVLTDLAGYVRGHLAPLLVGDVFLPEAKALLSRDGGVCPADGARLAFDPREPHRHRCPRCAAVLEGERHHRAWITRYQLWLSERAVHLALLAALAGEPDAAAAGAAAARILGAYADRYRSYPNRDNVLGPTRLFFSTYLESIWLVQVTIAAMLLDASRAEGLGTGARDGVRAMVDESAELIGSFNEGGSNRQVWNSAAQVAAGVWLDRAELVARGARGPSGVLPLLAAVDADGFWHEGENYHLFALRGFVLAAELLRWRGDVDLYATGVLGRMFAAPLLTLLPDLTLPARGDAPYGVSVRQPRFAELWEMGRARAPAPILDGVLARLYDERIPEGPDHGFGELAEQEENRLAARVRRSRLGWKALLWMRPDPPSAAPIAHEAARLLGGHGAAVLRPGERECVSLECGTGRAGHRHPDLLHVSVAWPEPVLADFGTGSYVAPSLFWYRSTLAHNAPCIAGRAQVPSVARCEALDASGSWSWCRAVSDDLVGPGSRVRRTIVAGPGLVVDILDVTAPDGVTVDLPLHFLGLRPPDADGLPDHDVVAEPDAGHETGYDSVREVRRVRRPYDPLRIEAPRAGVAMLLPRDGESVLLLEGPGPPGFDFADGSPQPFLLRRANGSGRWAAVYGRADAGLRQVSLGPDGLAVTTARGTVLVRPDATGATVSEPGTAACRLAGLLPVPSPPALPAAALAVDSSPPPVRVPRLSSVPGPGDPGLPVVASLGERAYRRSEAVYGAWGPFEAAVGLGVSGDAVVFGIDVVKSDLVVRDPLLPDPGLDNEAADIHSDGVQVYVGRGAWAGFVVLPQPDAGTVHVRAVAGTAAVADRVWGTSRRTETGYRVVVAWDTGGPFRPGDRFRFTVTVNEMRFGRERRAGQLALAGGGWAYLRGDRESPATAHVAVVV